MNYFSNNYCITDLNDNIKENISYPSGRRLKSHCHSCIILLLRHRTSPVWTHAQILLPLPLKQCLFKIIAKDSDERHFVRLNISYKDSKNLYLLKTSILLGVRLYIDNNSFFFQRCRCIKDTCILDHNILRQNSL